MAERACCISLAAVLSVSSFAMSESARLRLSPKPVSPPFELRARLVRADGAAALVIIVDHVGDRVVKAPGDLCCRHAIGLVAEDSLD